LRAPFLRKAAHEDKVILEKCVFPRAVAAGCQRHPNLHDAGNSVRVLTASVALDIASAPFAFYGIHMKYTVKPGEFEIKAGDSSREADLQKAILTVAT
jgi:hypothetical protein